MNDPERPDLAPDPESPTTHTSATTGVGGEEELSSGPGLGIGQILGDRYEIRAVLGRGGMGEVWQAFDLKLRVEVALKSLRPEHEESEKRRELLREEVRIAREIVSPNVCRVFDLIVEEGQELLSMEMIDGTTLLQLLKQRGPLSLPEAGELAAQFLGGLDAVHEAGLVHRDFKPENVMITRTGRVVVMDFGIAKQVASGDGTVSGTPAYMAPEQARGEAVDARADIFAAGVALAEMIAPNGIQDRTSRETLWKGIRQDPPEIPESPWQPVLRKAVSPRPEDRYATAQELVRALEQFALRVEGAEEKHPYPGLASFTEDDSEHFFGREAEVEALLNKLRRPHLLAVVGPSGAGKSSFLQAGLVPALPEGWRHVIAHPGEKPFLSLSQSLVPELSGDAEAIQELLRIEEPDAAVSVLRRWRQAHGGALFIVDQFEELFTLNPPEVQTRFTELLARLPLEADVHVLLSMRDDFLLQCHDHEALAPIFSELTPLRAPIGSALRRALVQPALGCGYGFEDETLVDEMLHKVAEERGALPLLAFAAASLWDRRDRETGHLTRAAYQEIGGVEGSLAQHAESILERIGTEREPIVRELFRNLVTAEGTRAVRDQSELLSVFEDRAAPAAVLKELVDARLVTSFEVAGEEGEGSEPSRQVEIVHESLLRAWPRLVRWQTQDADSAQFRDQLRQAARVWEERGRPDDLLWTGAAFLEYQVWRERYTGGLSANERAYADAMARHAGRQHRRRRIAVGAAFAVLVVVLGVVGGFWRRSEAARETAVLEARRATASKLLALGRLERENDPSGALAYALRSLELFDDPVVRQFALGVLWGGPTRIVVKDEMSAAVFSPDGRWLTWVGGGDGTDLELYSADGRVVARQPVGGGVNFPEFSPDSKRLVLSKTPFTTVWLYSVPDLTLMREMSFQALTVARFAEGQRDLLTLTRRGAVEGGDLVELRRWPSDEGEPTLLGSQIVGGRPGAWAMHLRENDSIALGRGRHVFHGSFGSSPQRPLRRVGDHEHPVAGVRLSPDARWLAAGDSAGEVRIFSTESPRALLWTVNGPRPAMLLRFNHDASTLAIGGREDRVGLVDLLAPPDATPLFLRSGDRVMLSFPEFHPSGDWIATMGGNSANIWPLGRRYPAVLQGHRGSVQTVAYSPDGRLLASGGFVDGIVRIWPLAAGAGETSRVVFEGGGSDGIWDVDFSPDGQRLLVGQASGRVHVVPLDGGPTRPLEGRKGQAMTVAFGPGGRLAAAGGGQWNPEERVIHVWDVETGEVRVLDAGDGHFIRQIRFLRDGRLLSATDAGGGLRLWDVEEGTAKLLREGTCKFALSPDERYVYSGCWEGTRHWTSEGREGRDAKALPLVRTDLATAAAEPLEQHFQSGELSVAIAVDPSGTRVVTGSPTGPIRVRPVAGGPEHLLLGHDTAVFEVAVSPDGRSIASASQDGTIRVWPMPEGRPFHKLPYEELLERLRALTNLRIIEDESSSTGYRVEAGPFPGWEKLPTW